MRVIVEQGCHNGTTEFSHPLVKKAVQAIGIVTLGMSEEGGGEGVFPEDLCGTAGKRAGGGSHAAGRVGVHPGAHRGG